MNLTKTSHHSSTVLHGRAIKGMCCLVVSLPSRTSSVVQQHVDVTFSTHGYWCDCSSHPRMMLNRTCRGWETQQHHRGALTCQEMRFMFGGTFTQQQNGLVRGSHPRRPQEWGASQTFSAKTRNITRNMKSNDEMSSFCRRCLWIIHLCSSVWRRWMPAGSLLLFNPRCTTAENTAELTRRQRWRRRWRPAESWFIRKASQSKSIP